MGQMTDKARYYIFLIGAPKAVSGEKPVGCLVLPLIMIMSYFFQKPLRQDLFMNSSVERTTTLHPRQKITLLWNGFPCCNIMDAQLAYLIFLILFI